jgi:hypothetical protein
MLKVRECGEQVRIRNHVAVPGFSDPRRRGKREGKMINLFCFKGVSEMKREYRFESDERKFS